MSLGPIWERGPMQKYPRFELAVSSSVERPKCSFVYSYIQVIHIFIYPELIHLYLMDQGITGLLF